MKNNAVGWFELYVQDMNRAKAFYETVFEVKLESLAAPPNTDGQDCDAEMEMWAFPMADNVYGAPGALVRMDDVSSGPGGTMVYFSCEDCASEAARVVQGGGSVFREKMPIGEYGFMAIVNDTEGNMIGLHSMK